jgi:predicted protein tyrosine phosphatase
MEADKKILFICDENINRSRTGEAVLKDSPDYEVQSAGVQSTANRPITKEILQWANLIFVFEKRQRNIIHKKFPDIHKEKSIICLYIQDEYAYMDPELVHLIKSKVSRFLKPETSPAIQKEPPASQNML